MGVVRLVRNRKGLLVRLGGGGQFVLDTYSGAAAAYSLRKLSSSYSGSAVRVRRSFDDTELDIGFNADGTLDTFSLLSFAGAGDAFVTTWYDQSGEVNNVVQTTAINQPQIVSSGVLYLDNNKPAIQGSASTGLGTASALTFSDSEYISVFSTQNYDLSANNIIFETSPNFNLNNGSVLFIAEPTEYRFNQKVLASNYTGVDFTPSQTGTQLISSILDNTVVNRVDFCDSQFNGNSLTEAVSSTGTPIAYNDSELYLYSRAGTSLGFQGTYQEFILYKSDQTTNRVGIQRNINSYYNIYWDGTQTSTLDTYSGASAAYSLRALNSAYTGPLIRVRRSSDSEEQDIYALYDGTLDTETLETFVGANDGLVTTWYDQSGNGDNVTQTTSPSQPKIVSAGVVNTIAGLPTLDFSASSAMHLDNISISATTNTSSFFTVVKTTTDLQIISDGNNGSSLRNVFSVDAVGTGTYGMFAGTIQGSGTQPSGSADVLSVFFDSLSDMYFNGTKIIDQVDEGSFVRVGLTLGASFNGGAGLKGQMSEYILYDDVNKSSDRLLIEREINSVYQTYWDGTKTGLLDTYPDATAAYSLRALSSNYTGPLVKVRRASDSEEVDIFADYNGNLDTTALEAFCAATDGFVSVWYDQSGNGLDAEQPTTTSQPRIVSAGSIDTLNGNPAVNYIDNNDILILASESLIKSSFSISSVTIQNNVNYIYGSDTGDGDTITSGLLNQGGAGGINGLTIFSEPNTEKLDNTEYLSIQELQTYIDDSSSSKLAINGNPLTSFTRVGDVYLKGLGGRPSRTFGLSGLMQEAIFYNSDQSANRAGIEQAINSNYQIYWDGTSSGILDTYSGASAAYSLRALSSTYTGPMVRVRRASDNAETDIYATYAGDLDTTSLETFCSGTDGFVTTWYDQSGNGANTTQTTSGDQPQIVSSGSVITKYDFPSIEFSGSEWLENTSNGAAGGNNFYYSIVGSQDASLGVGGALCFTNATNSERFTAFFDSRNSIFRNFLIADNASDTVSSVSNQSKLDENKLYLQSGERETLTTKAYLNGDLKDTQASASDNFVFDKTIIGAQAAGGTPIITYLTGNISEVLVWNNNQSSNRTSIESNINSYYNIYWDGSQEGLLDEHSDSINRTDQSLKFDGVNDYVDLPATFTSSVQTVSFWVKFNTFNGFDGIIGSSIGSFNFIRYNEPNNRFQVRSSDGVQLVFGSGALATDTWYHVLYADNGAVSYMYLNGVLLGSQATGFSYNYNQLGTQNDITNLLNGELSDVLITDSYNAPASDASFIYNGGVGRNPLSLFPDATYLYRFNNNINNDGTQSGDATLNGFPANPYTRKYPDASAAYSLRALNSAYTGPLVRVRRSSDNEEQDIRALYDGSLDEEGLLGFVGTGGTDDGLITKWYDQSGNSQHLEQSTITAQPVIVNGGVLVENNSLPAIDFDTDNKEIGIDSKVLSQAPVTAITVCKSEATARVGAVFGTNTNENADGFRVFHETRATPIRNVIVSIGGTNYFADLPAVDTAQNTRLLTGVIRSDLTVVGYRDNIEVIGDVSSGDFTNINLYIAPKTGAASSLTMFQGLIQECIFYNSDKRFNLDDIHDKINTQYNIY